jgi:DNA (cytosine-5)-methyltransferase 1
MARLLDLFCCEGGAARGYLNAGFDEVVGVDNNEEYWYRYGGSHTDPRTTFVHDDALTYLFNHGDEFDAIHASPPCQFYSVATSPENRAKHPDLLEITRNALDMIGKPYVIENVEGARQWMKAPITLCGSMFNLFAIDEDGEMLRMERHRLFDLNWDIEIPANMKCFHPRSIKVAGAYGGGSHHKKDMERRGGYVPKVSVIKNLMGIDWMTRRGLNQAIPPSYTEFIGRQLLAVVGS